MDLEDETSTGYFANEKTSTHTKKITFWSDLFILITREKSGAVKE